MKTGKCATGSCPYYRYPREDALKRHQDSYCKGPAASKNAADKTRLRASTFWEVLLEEGEDRAKAYVEEAKRLQITIWSGLEHGVSYGHPPSVARYVPPQVKEPERKVKVPRTGQARPTPTLGFEVNATPIELPDFTFSRSVTPEPRFSVNVRGAFNYSYADYGAYFSAYPLERFNPCPPVLVTLSG